MNCRDIKFFMVLICVVEASTVLCMSIESKKSEKQSIIELFTGIKEEYCDLLPAELKIPVIDKTLTERLLLNKPWHYIENIINDGSLSLCFTQDNEIGSVSRDKISYIDFTVGSAFSVPYTKPCWNDEVCLNKNGRQLAIFGQHQGKIINLQNSDCSVEISNRFWGDNGGIRALCFNHEGTWLAVASTWNDMVTIVDVENGKEVASSYLRSLLFGDNPINALCFDDTSQRIAIGHNKGVLIGNVSTKGKIKKFNDILRNNKVSVASLSFNHDGTVLAVASHNGNVYILDALTGECMYYLVFNKLMTSLSFDSAGKRLIVGSSPYSLYNFTRIINQYDNFTIKQLILRKLMDLFWRIKKQKATIRSVHEIFNKMAQLFCLDNEELNQVWLTFPRFMQIAIEQTLIAKIVRHGKYKKIASQCIKKRKRFSLFRSKKNREKRSFL